MISVLVFSKFHYNCFSLDDELPQGRGQTRLDLIKMSVEWIMSLVELLFIKCKSSSLTK